MPPRIHLGPIEPRVRERIETGDVRLLARRLYDACPTVKPDWEQLGDVTKSVWVDKARRKLAGDPEWWSIFLRKTKQRVTLE